ncbi:helicase C-terminal domain-containing protein [Halothermothrix orenii]|uniref:DNA 5'-3' helicase n=1 Tax=Halothermothrix orenii (strain H 168 / OCM 544 / DSM 9562) TaxID=373903 RepID=B8CW80_HALOH|nr:helicase C-terminal domain-containing protein [Halothermothrix orenii]ACL69549.1 helicase c2 [Halothermothrix orenii H 168]
MTVEELFAKSIITNIRHDIQEAGGQEIYLIGDIDVDTGKIMDYTLLARGNLKMVPAIISDLKPGQVIVHNHPSSDLTPSAADIRIASRMGNQGIGFIIIDNDLNNAYVVVEPKIPHREVQLDIDEIIEFFEPGGSLSQFLNDYEYREQQLEVVREVINSFNNHEFTLIEAGTGTGKSFAYLVPALFWAKKNEKTVVVSTNTINLQEQLIYKDLVLLKKALSFDFKAVMVKGRSNYICKRKIKHLEQELNNYFDDDPEKQVQFYKVLDWLEESKSGSKSELNFVVDNEIWNEIASETDLCLRTNCPFFDTCYFMKARKEVFSADILIVNHHLLLSDIMLKSEYSERDGGILPRYSNLIIDEAHNFDEIASRHLGRPFYYKLLHKYLNKVYYPKNRLSLIPRIRNRFSATNLKNKKEVLKIIDTEIVPQVKRVEEQSHEYFQKLNEFVNQDGEGVIRLTQDIIEGEAYSKIVDSGDTLLGNLNNLGIYLNNLYEEFMTLNSSDISNFEELIIELEAYINRCQHFAKSLEFNIKAEEENYVFWIEKDYNLNVKQENAPLKVSNIIDKILWETMDNVILTSATLTVNDNFNYFKTILGINKCSQLKIESPFNYSEQATLIISDDIPPANSKKYLPVATDILKEMLLLLRGSTLVLFTSYSMLNYCTKKIEPVLKDDGIVILPQGRYPRKYILETFKANSNQVIFGTMSFWEGVDIKGDDLRYLVMMKLPFPVPTEPVSAARMEQLKEEGKNPFTNFSLPNAVIRFKQGFGRLIRSSKDTGKIICLDSRIKTKSYGRVFLNSIPSGCPVKVMDKTVLLQELHNSKDK